MVKEIQLEGKGWARGRNGYFIPRRVDCFKDVKGQINLSVSSAHPGKVEPISIRLTKTEALKLVSVICSLAGRREETPRVVVVIEGGNIQEILADRPVKVVKVLCRATHNTFYVEWLVMWSEAKRAVVFH